ncbi:MAG: hypothetical protein GC129_06780 [Proteobacteria bacterium]|nr:hypothetical protein [Pseudomonadota bacterium]
MKKDISAAEILTSADPHTALMLRMQREGHPAVARDMSRHSLTDFAHKLSDEEENFVRYLEYAARRSLWQHLKDDLADGFWEKAAPHIRLPDWLLSRI